LARNVPHGHGSGSRALDGTGRIKRIGRPGRVVDDHAADRRNLWATLDAAANAVETR